MLDRLPVPVFIDLGSEAREWAILASQAEKRAFLTAVWSRMADADRDDFLRAVTKKRKASP